MKECICPKKILRIKVQMKGIRDVLKELDEPHIKGFVDPKNQA